MPFPFNYFLAAFVGAFLTTLLTLPGWRQWCFQVKLVDDPGDRKIHDVPMPLGGGLAVLTGVLAPLAVGLLYAAFTVQDPHVLPPIAYGFDHRAWELAGIALGAVAITALGCLDDKRELKPLPKFAGQFTVALLVALSGARITLFVHSLAFSYAITVLWMLTVINAFNFMDNMNGLCAGLGAIGAALFTLIAASHGQYLVALTGFLMCGALLGFLPYNFPRARAFWAIPAATWWATCSRSWPFCPTSTPGNIPIRSRCCRRCWCWPCRCSIWCKWSCCERSAASRFGWATPTTSRTGSCAPA